MACGLSGTNNRRSEKNSLLFVCHCLRARDWWSGRGNLKFPGVTFDTRRDRHNAELAGATTISCGKWHWEATLLGDRESHMIVPMGVMVLTRRPRSPQKAEHYSCCHCSWEAELQVPSHGNLLEIKPARQEHSLLRVDSQRSQAVPSWPL